MAYHFFAGGEVEPVFVELDGAESAWFAPDVCRRIAESAAPMHDELRAVFRAGAADPRGVEMF